MASINPIHTPDELARIEMSIQGGTKGGITPTVSRRLVTATTTTATATTATTVTMEENEKIPSTASVRGFDAKGRELRASLSLENTEWGGVLKDTRSVGASATIFEGGMLPMVDVGKNLNGLFPCSWIEMEQHVAKCLEMSKLSATKIQGRPANFGPILPGIYRSSYPQSEDFEYLRSLGLKSIVTLVKKDIPEDYRAFMESQGIQHFVIDMQGTKKEPISQAMMASIMELVLNPANHPVLLHCNHGRHRTGCATAVIRHLSGWDLPAIITEYEGYASPKVRECDIQYISQYQVSWLRGLFLPKRTVVRMAESSTTIALERRMSRFLLGTIVVLMIWLSTVGILGKG